VAMSSSPKLNKCEVWPRERALARPGADTVARDSELESFDVYPTAIPVELYAAVHESKNGIIASETDVSARQEFGSPLPENDVSGDHGLSSKFLHT
jgi:hypothetical protein